MDFVRGRVVRSSAGRDKNSFLVVLQADSCSAVVCDGKRRRLEHPKKKNLKHLSPTGTTLPEDRMRTDREIRRVLAGFRDAGPLSR